MNSSLLPRFVRRSYAAKFALVLGLVTLVIALVGGYSYLHANEVVGDETRDDLVTNAEIQAQNLDEWLTRMEVQMRSLSESAAFQSGDERDVNLYLWSVVERDHDIDAAYYIDTKNETVITSTGSASVASAESVTKYYGRQEFTALAQQAHGDIVVSEPFRPTDDAAPVILFATTVPDEPNRAVIAVSNLRDVSETHLHDIDDGRFVVVDTEGTVVLAEDESNLLSTDSVAVDRYGNKSGFVSGLTLRGSSTELGYAKLEAHDWTVSARVPSQEAYALRTDILTQILVTLLVVGLGTGVLAVTIGRDTTEAVQTLSSKAAALRDGNLNVSIDRTREDEFGDIYEAFDVMRSSLRAQIREAEQAREAAEAARQEAWAEKEASERRRRHLEQTAAVYGEVMRACADGDLTQRIDPDEESEAMREVAQSFNEMMDDVQTRNEQLETVSHVLSHDLRSPLNVAVGRAELLAEEADNCHVDPLVTSLDRIDAIIDDAIVLALQRRVEDTLPVALFDAAERAWSHVDTGDATLSLVDQFRFVADPDLAAHVFENLFRNAVDHGGDDVTVRVGALPDGSGFYVEDDGPGIPQTERTVVFEPGHTTNRAGGGTGFGLPIVKQVADVHEWTVAIETATTGGARFEITDVTTDASDTGDATSLV
ncbi:HAMP domain-containing sensor histidine kinase [Haloferax profundi]|uniref:histidine kinase n=1 Tax=Haloferax profundi TaxID=1544718 RepID=A0A0W1SM12_9EURY|nr:ATP-binding protein [Haloferax profundi]KTG27178.1 chemotaxis protein [Haloferax profundi]